MGVLSVLLNSLGTHLQLKRNAHLSPPTEFLSQLCLPSEFFTIQSLPMKREPVF